MQVALFEIGEAELMALVSGIMVPFTRIGAMLIAAPMFGARTIPVRIRVVLGLLLAMLVYPHIEVPADFEAFSAAGALLLAREVLIGTATGFLLQMMFAAMAMAGEIIALTMGLAFASIVDPDRGGSVPLVGQYFVIFSTLLFLAFDGHLALIALLIESLTTLPPAAAGLGADGFAAIAAWGTRMFEAAVFVALPASAALLVTSVSMGLIARSAPQLNIFAVGFPMTLLLGLAALLFSLPSLGGQLEQVLEAVLGHGRAVQEAWQ